MVEFYHVGDGSLQRGVQKETFRPVSPPPLISKQASNLSLYHRLLPLMLEQCKMKKEDFEKFKKDKINAEVLERKKQISRMTIRSKAAKTIEKISGRHLLLTNLNHSAKFQKEVFFAIRGQLERYLNSKLWEEK